MELGRLYRLFGLLLQQRCEFVFVQIFVCAVELHDVQRAFQELHV